MDSRCPRYPCSFRTYHQARVAQSECITPGMGQFEQMVIWYRWQVDLEKWREKMEDLRGEIESRFEGVEAVHEKAAETTVGLAHQEVTQMAPEKPAEVVVLDLSFLNGELTCMVERVEANI